MEQTDALRLLVQNERERQSLRQVLSRIPREIEGLERQFGEEKSVLENANAEMDALVKRRRDLETGSQDLLAQKKTYDDQLPMIKKNEEYRAALSQIEFIKEKISKNEDAILQTFEEEDAVSERVAKAESVYKRSEERLSSRKAELEGELERSRGELARLDAAAADLVAELPKDLARRYEQVSASKEMAVAPVSGASCGGCFTSLTPQIINDLRHGQSVHACDNCGRIIVWEEGTSS